MTEPPRAMSAGGFVSRRRFDDVEAAVLDVGTMHFRPSDDPRLLQCAPWSWERVCEPDGRVVLGVNVVVVRTPAATIVIDPCTFAPDALTAGDAVVVPGAHLDRGLQALGVAADEATHVVVTHAHEDHFSGALADDGGLRFPRALHVLPAADWRSIIVPGHPFAASAHELRRRLPLSGEPGGALLVDGDREITEGVGVLHTPGETDGHQIVRVQMRRERLYVLGDLVHWTAELEDPRLMGPTSSPTAARRRFLAQASEQPCTVVFSHARFPAWGTLVAVGPDTWRWEDLGG